MPKNYSYSHTIQKTNKMIMMKIREIDTDNDGPTAKAAIVLIIKKIEELAEGIRRQQKRHSSKRQ